MWTTTFCRRISTTDFLMKRNVTFLGSISEAEAESGLMVLGSVWEGYENTIVMISDDEYTRYTRSDEMGLEIGWRTD